MTIIIGLGNPGAKFKETRHNIGFLAIDRFAEKNNFSDFKLNKKSNSLISESIIDGQKVLLAKPQTFMNSSGLAVKKILTNYGLRATDYVVIVHDDIDLPIGKIKIVKERGSAGHKGVESIIRSIGKKDLIRFRIGIAPQSRGSDHRTKAKKIVLKKFIKEEQKIIEQTIEKAAEALKLFIKEGLEKTMNQYN